MTLEQEQQLEQLLKQWREERHLSIESQRDGLIGNLCEEMAEYYRATNKSEKIDALCDMYVFCMNSLDEELKLLYNKYTSGPVYPAILKYSMRFSILQFIADDTVRHLNVNSAAYMLMKNIEREVKELDYNFYKCMMETIKEISSRTGHYDENIHKFVKDKSEEAKSKWYKADYEKCKIKE